MKTLGARRPSTRITSSGLASDAGQPVLAGITALTVIGLVLRAVGMGQSLYGDERYTHVIVTQNSLRGVWHQVYDTSITPPLHYFLAWFFVQFGGDSTVLVRMPSLILGTALIPLVFALGRRIGGSRVGLVAAGLIALSPFAIFYSTEARAYETMVFLVTLSTFAMLKAGDGDSRAWWIVYVLSSCAALWTHYTALFVLVAQAAWAFWARAGTRRQLLVAEAAIVVGYLPWLPGYLHQRHNPGVGLFSSFSSVTVHSVFGFSLRTLIGRPFVGLDSIPGTLGLILLVLVAALAIAAAARRPEMLPRVPQPRTEKGLAIILALATPVGLLLYGLVGTTLFSSPRELSASQPPLMIVIALALVWLTRAAGARVGAVAVAALTATLTVVAVKSVDADNQRPPYKGVAHYLDTVAGNSPVVEFRLAVSPDARLHQSALSLYFKRRHGLYVNGQNDSLWRSEQTGGTVYYVQPLEAEWIRLTGFDTAPPALRARIEALGGPDGRAIERGQKTFPGFYPIVVRRYSGAVTGRLERHAGTQTITWSLGKRVTVAPDAAVGAVSLITPSRSPLLIAGWGLDARRHGLVDWFLFFSHGRLFAVSAGGLRSKDAGKITGSSAVQAGFAFQLKDAPTDHSSIRVFAVVGNRASEVPLTPAARRALSKG